MLLLPAFTQTRTEKRYGGIMLDPAWRFEVWSRDTGMGRSADSHYTTLTLDDMMAFDLQRYMLPDCAVFMWATLPMLPEALQLGAAWGLRYRTTAFVWAKTSRKGGQPQMFGRIDDDRNWHMGMGYWTRANAELCLLFTRGNPKRKSKSVRQLVVAPIGEHSAKPDIHSRIEALVDGPYAEFFARRRYPGWDCYGNELDGTDLRLMLKTA